MGRTLDAAIAIEAFSRAAARQRSNQMGAASSVAAGGVRGRVGAVRDGPLATAARPLAAAARARGHRSARGSQLVPRGTRLRVRADALARLARLEGVRRPLAPPPASHRSRHYWLLFRFW